MKMQLISKIVPDIDTRLVVISTVDRRPSVDLFTTGTGAGPVALVQTEVWLVTLWSVTQWPVHPEYISLDGFEGHLEKNKLPPGDYIFVTRTPFRVGIEIWHEEEAQ